MERDRKKNKNSKSFLEKIAFFCASQQQKRSIIFQLQILHLIKYECIFAFIYEQEMGGNISILNPPSCFKKECP